MNDPAPSHSSRPSQIGVAYGLSACVAWSLVPIYYKAITHVPVLEVLAHRIVWSVLFLLAWMRVRNHWPATVGTLKDRRTLLTLGVTTLLIATNWTTFIWSVAHDHLLDSSLGYFITPLVQVLLGFVFLRERLRPAQTASILLAAVGVAYLTFRQASVPWIALVLAGTFGCYSLLRKTTRANALSGLLVETSLFCPLALAYLIFLGVNGDGEFGAASRTTDGLLIGTGLATALPLLWFTNAVRRLRLATVGILGYIAPSAQFVLAVFVYDETFTTDHVVAFAAIWTALLIYTVDALRMPNR